MLHGSGDVDWLGETTRSGCGFSSIAGGRHVGSLGFGEKGRGGKHAASPSLGDGEEKAEVTGLDAVDAVKLSNMLGAELSVGEAGDTGDGGPTSIAGASALRASKPNGS